MNFYVLRGRYLCSLRLDVICVQKEYGFKALKSGIWRKKVLGLCLGIKIHSSAKSDGDLGLNFEVVGLKRGVKRAKLSDEERRGEKFFVSEIVEKKKEKEKK